MTEVLYCAPRLFSPGAGGGGERYASELLSSLRKDHGLHIRVVVGESYRGLYEEKFDTAAHRKLLRVVDLSRLVQGADVVHVSQLNSHVSDVMLMLCRLHRKPVVLTDYGGGWRTAGRALGSSRLRLVSGVAAISMTSAVDIGWDRSRPTRLLYGGGEHLPEVPRSTREPTHDFVYVGRIVPHKGLDLLVSSLPDGATCLIAGAPLDPEYLRALRGRADAAQVTFQLAPDDVQVVEAYRSARWSVFPTMQTLNGRRVNRPELLGLSPIESLWLGVPTLLSDIPAYRELAGIVGAPTFVADQSASLRLRLAECLVAEAVVDFDAVRRELSWSSAADRTASLYTEVMSDE